jgi:hypothetical protein
MTYRYRTVAGVFEIVPRRHRWHILFEGQDLGGYATARQAADSVAAGLSFFPSNGVDPGTLSISHELRDWAASI